MKPLIGVIALIGPSKEASTLTRQAMRTKELCEKTGVSEATLRRWLREGTVPELADVTEDWRGWREWDYRHVEAIRRYQEHKKQQRKARGVARPSPQFNLPLKNGPKRKRGGS